MFYDFNKQKYTFSHLHLYDIHKMYILTSQGAKLTAKIIEESQKKLKPKTRFDTIEKEKEETVVKYLSSIFLEQKLDQQRRMKRRIYYDDPSEKNGFNGDEAARQDFEALYNDYLVLQKARKDLQEELDKSKEIIQKLRSENKELRERQMSLNTQIDKHKVQKELLSKEIAYHLDEVNCFDLHSLSEKHTFGNIMDEQLVYAKQWRIVAKYGMRWLRKVRNKLYKV